MSVGDQLDAILKAFVATPWDQLGVKQSTAKGMCKRVSVALLATLKREDIQGQLWDMARLDPTLGRAAGRRAAGGRAGVAHFASGTLGS